MSSLTEAGFWESSGAEDGIESGSGAKGPSSDSLASFSGDTGQLSVPLRRVLVQLLLGPVVDGRRHPVLWNHLLQDEAVVRSRLHEMFLELVVDRQQSVAFTRQVVSDDLDVPVLLRRAPLTFLESALLLFIRKRLTQADVDGERAVVDRNEIIDFLQTYERSGNSDKSRFDRQLSSAIEKARKLNWLSSLKNSEDRFEVSPTLKLLFTAEHIQALTKTYEDVLNHMSTDAASDGDNEVED